MKNKFLEELLSWAKTIALAFIIAMVIKTFIFRPIFVKGSSMEPTLSDGEILVMWKLNYQFSSPKQGDIVIIKNDQDKLEHKSLIKRVVGLPHDEIKISDNKVYINGRLLDPDFTPFPTPSNGFKESVVEEDKYFVMGDNRVNSRDSRDPSVGFIDRENIEGEAVFRLYPFNKIGVIK